MEQIPAQQSIESEFENRPNVQLIHSVLHILLAVRYRKNLVLAVMAAAALLGGLYYATAPRRYSAKAGLLITQSQPDSLDTSMTNGESVRQNTMPTFENIARSATVVENTMKKLSSVRFDLISRKSSARSLGGCLQVEPRRQVGSIHERLGIGTIVPGIREWRPT